MVRKHWPLVLVFYCLSSHSWAQFDQLVSSKQAPQAQSQQELDEYLAIVYAETPEKKIQLIERFIHDYPISNFQGIVYQSLMMTYQETGNYRGVIESGERALKTEPDNLNTLLTLAAAIPNGVSGNGTDDSRRLAQAEQYARRVFEGIERIKLPRSMSRQRWETLSREMQSSARESLGHIASKRGNWQEAVAYFEAAVRQNPVPSGRQFYRLGVAYMLRGSNQSARAALHQAAELGPDEIREVAAAVLKRIDNPKSR